MRGSRQLSIPLQGSKEKNIKELNGTLTPTIERLFKKKYRTLLLCRATSRKSQIALK
jgi:hypothetical protein